jgi:hypothetical protein
MLRATEANRVLWTRYLFIAEGRFNFYLKRRGVLAVTLRDLAGSDEILSGANAILGRTNAILGGTEKIPGETRQSLRGTKEADKH